MNELHFTLITDGSSDRVLVHHLRWILKNCLGSQVAIQSQWADLRSLRDKPVKLVDKICITLELYPCDLLFIHRDAENAGPAQRLREITEAVITSQTTTPVVPVVPVRMTEAWLLFDERAIRLAAGNPNGSKPLEIPHKNPESISNPKLLLHDALRKASELRGRRLRQFRPAGAIYRIAECIDDFSQLHGVMAFDNLCDSIDSALRLHKGSLVSPQSQLHIG